MWRELVGMEQSEPDTRWMAGDTRDAVRREATLGRGSTRWRGRRWSRTLRPRCAQGWHMLVPPDGMPVGRSAARALVTGEDR